MTQILSVLLFAMSSVQLTVAGNYKTVKEERRLVDTFSEFYLNDKADIETFIHMFAVNASEFDYTQFMNIDVKETKTSNIILPGQ